MLQSTEIKPGTCFIWEGELYQAIDVARNKTAMAKMKINVKVRMPRTGVVKELGLIGSDKVEEAFIDKREMQYLYNEGENYIFMDLENYDQIEIPSEQIGDQSKFLIENMTVKVMIFQGNEIIGVSLPDKVELKIVECEEAVKGDTATSASKKAIVETGLEVKVPLFIKNGETIIVSTLDGKYVGRA